MLQVVNKAECESFSIFIFSDDGGTEPDLQVKRWCGTSGNGSLLQIPGRTIALCMKLGMPKAECGWFKAPPTQNGNLLSRARSYGLTENVSISTLYVYLELTVTVSAAGAGKSFVWYDNILIAVFARLCNKVVPQSLTTSKRHSERHSHSFTVTSGRIKRGIVVGYSRHSWSSLVNSPMHTQPNFLVSMRPIVVDRNMQATMSY